MKDLFTPNFESDADAVAPKLAKLSGSSVAIYHWLHSRAFACGNKIGVSERWLAEHLDIALRTVQRAVDGLVKAGLINHVVIRGGSEFSLCHLTTLSGDKSVIGAMTNLSHDKGPGTSALSSQTCQLCHPTERGNYEQTPHTGERADIEDLAAILDRRDPENP
jgi:hypothetical protein